MGSIRYHDRDTENEVENNLICKKCQNLKTGEQIVNDISKLLLI